jgi:hypothetical protein
LQSLESSEGTLAFDTRLNLTYHVEFSEDTVNWTRAEAPVVGTGGVVMWQDPEVHGTGCPCTDAAHRLYRVVIGDAGN